MTRVCSLWKASAVYDRTHDDRRHCRHAAAYRQSNRRSLNVVGLRDDAAIIPPVMVGLRNTVIGLTRWAGYPHSAAACRRFASQPAFALELLGMTLKNCMALTPGCARSAGRRPPGWRTGRRHAFGDPCRFIAEALGEDDEVDDLGRVGAPDMAMLILCMFCLWFARLEGSTLRRSRPVPAIDRPTAPASPGAGRSLAQLRHARTARRSARRSAVHPDAAGLGR